MEILYKLGIGDTDIKTMLEVCPNIRELNNEEIEEKIILLEKLECTEKQIKNIIVSNPIYLDRMNEEVISLVNRLISLGMSSLNIVFDSYPYLLNKDVFEIEEYLDKKEGNLEDIIDELESNPYLIDEI